MTPCLVVFIGVLCTVAHVDTRLVRRSETNKVRRSSRNGNQYVVPQSRRFSSSTFRREAQGDLGSGLVSSIQKQVADQISFQQDLQKKIQDRVQQKLADKYKELEDKLTKDDSQSQWYIPNNSWWPDNNYRDNDDNSFMIFGPGSMSRSLSRNNAKSRRLSTETVSQRMSGYNPYPGGPQPTPPFKGAGPRPPHSPIGTHPSQSSAGGPVPGHIVTPISPGHVPTPTAPGLVPTPTAPESSSCATSPGTSQIQITLPSFDSMMGGQDITSIPGLQDMMKLAGINLSNMDLSSMLGQIPDISQLFSMEGLTGGAVNDALDLVGPYSLSLNNGKSAWNVNINPGESTRRQFDEFVDPEEFNEQTETGQYDEFIDPNQLSEQTETGQYDEFTDANQYMPSGELDEEGFYDPLNSFDETDAFENIGDFSEFDQYNPEDANSLVDPNIAQQDIQNLDDTQQLSSEQCAAIQNNCLQCIEDPASFDSKYNPMYGTDPAVKKRRNRSGRRKFRSNRRSNRRRYSSATRRQYEQLDQPEEYNPEQSYDQNGIYDGYENIGTYDQYEPAEQDPVDSMIGSDCQSIEKKCAQCIISAMNDVNSANYDQQLDQTLDEQQPLDYPYGDVQRRFFNKFGKNRRDNRASRANRMARRRRLFT